MREDILKLLKELDGLLALSDLSMEDWDYINERIKEIKSKL